MLFDKICRQNAITHRLTQPASPTTTGKIERFHLTLRRELLDGHQLFESVEAAQAAVDGFVEQYNADRPHQGVGPRPAGHSGGAVQRRSLRSVASCCRSGLPPTLTAAATPVGGSAKDADEDGTANAETSQPAVEGWVGGPVEFDRVVPPSGNMQLAGKQFWLGPSRAGQVVRFWASVDLIHLLIGGVKIKTVRSHLTVNDLARLVVQGAANAGPSPLPPIEHGAAVEVDRVVSRGGTIALGGMVLLAAEILAGRQVGIRIEPDTLMFFDLQTRELLRVRPNPLSAIQVARLRGNRPAGPPPRPSLEPVRVQRRASNSGIVMVCGQKIALGRLHRWQTVTIAVSETTLAIELARPGNPKSSDAQQPPPCVTSKLPGHDRAHPKLSRPSVKASPDTDPLSVTCLKAAAASPGSHERSLRPAVAVWRASSCSGRFNVTTVACAIGAARTARSDAVRAVGTGAACRSSCD